MTASWQHTCAGLLLLLALLAAMAPAPTAAAPIPWRESGDTQLQLGAADFAPAVGTTVTLTFQGSVLTNGSSQAQHAGLYVGGMWVWQNYLDPVSPFIALSWDNTTQRYAGSEKLDWGANVAMTVSAATLSPDNLLLGSLLPPSSVGTPLASPGATDITPQDDWLVPLLDFGVLGAGEEVVFDLAFTLDFGDAGLAQQWSDLGSYDLRAQGLQAVLPVPEPGSLVLVACALAAAAVATRRRRSAAA